jgi:hypothetical protein
MAGDWIPVRINLQTDPRTIAIGVRLRKPALFVVGGLVAIWGAANEHTTDGRLKGYTPASIDAMIGCKGFGAAMEAVNWLIVEPDAVVVPDFDRYNSDGAKTRLQGARRAARLRHDQSARKAHESNAGTVTNGARKAHVSRTKSAPTEQNRTEEKQQQQSFPLCAGSLADPDPPDCPAAAAPAAAAISHPVLQALHDREIGEPTASTLVAEGCTLREIRAADLLHEDGDGPGLTVVRLREAMAAAVLSRAKDGARQQAKATFDAMTPEAQSERIGQFRQACEAQGLEVRHMRDDQFPPWPKFVDWLADQGETP